MGNTKVSFLEEIYSFPEELQEYVIYMKEFEAMYDRLFSILTARIKRKWYDYPDEEFKEILHNEARRIISNLSSYDIYDVSLSDLIGQNKGLAYLDEMTKEEFEKRKQISIDAIRDYQEKLENAQTHAASQITGSRMALISNSVLAHMTFSALESNTIKRQMNKADDEFKRTMKAIEYQNTSTKERRENDLLFKSTYPKYADVVTLFVTELTEKFFGILEQHNVYQYSKVIPYNSQRSSELLDNIDLVDEANKKKVLVQAFQSCPYNANVYYKAIELNFADFDLISTIDTYEQRESLIELLYENAKKLVESNNESVTVQRFCRWISKLENKQYNEVLKNILEDKLYTLTRAIKRLVQVTTDELSANDLYDKLTCISGDDLYVGNLEDRLQKNIKRYMDENLNKADVYYLEEICNKESIQKILNTCGVNETSILDFENNISALMMKNFLNITHTREINKFRSEKKKKKTNLIIISVVGIIAIVFGVVFIGNTSESKKEYTSRIDDFEVQRHEIEEEIPQAIQDSFKDEKNIVDIKISTDFKKIEANIYNQGEIWDNVLTYLYLDAKNKFGKLSNEEKYNYIMDQEEKMILAIDKVKDKHSKYEEYIDDSHYNETKFYDYDFLIDLSREDVNIIYNGDTYSAFAIAGTWYLSVNDESIKVKDN